MRIFRKNIDPRCAYCARGVPFGNDEIGCIKNGVVPALSHCRHFKYDPLKRVPVKPPVLKKNYSGSDFSIS